MPQTTATPTRTGGALYEKAQAFEAKLKAPFVEKDEDVYLMVLAIFAGQHIAQIGLPGLAKSMVADRATKLVADARIYDNQFFKGTQAEEVFGPLDPVALMDGRWVRLVEDAPPYAYLPGAHIAHLDEWWKTNSLVMNGSLRIVNERKFKNGGQVVDCPLWTAIISSNELPEPGNTELAAIRDRILITRITQTVRTDQGRLDMLGGFLDRQANGLDEEPVMTADEVTAAQAQVRKIEVPAEVKGDLTTLWRKAEEAGITVSPRRMLQAVTVLQAKAWLAGRKAVLPDDLTVYQHMLWTDPDDIATAHAVTLEFASEFEKAAAKLRAEYEDVIPEINVVREHLAEDPVDFSTMTPVAAKAHSTLKGIMERVKSQIEQATEAKRDTRKLDDLLDEVASAREFIRQKALGMD